MRQSDESDPHRAILYVSGLLLTLVANPSDNETAAAYRGVARRVHGGRVVLILTIAEL